MTAKKRNENPVNIVLLVVTIVSVAVAGGTLVAYFSSGNGSSPRVEAEESPEVQALEEQLRQNPQNMETLLNLAHMYLDEGRIDLASQNYQRALEIDPENVEALVHMGIVHRGTGEFDDAVKSFEQALSKNPDYAHGWWDKALTLDLKGDHQGAITAWQQFLRLVPTGSDADQAKELITEAEKKAAEKSASTSKTTTTSSSPE